MGGFFGGGGGTTPTNMVGASTSVTGTAGYVPAPAAGKNTRALFSDASFSEAPMLPQYAPANTRYVLGYALNDAQANDTIGNTRRRLFTLAYVPADGNVGTLTFRTGNASPTSINCHIAMWDIGNDGLPSTYIIGGTASAGTATATDINVSVTSTAVKRGFCYISVTPETALPSGALVCGTPSANSHYTSFIGATACAGQNGDIFGYTATTYNQTTHETFVLYNVRYPKAAFKYA